MQTQYLLLLNGCLCLTIALVLAWLLTFRFISDEGLVARIFPDKFQLVKAHIDYLLMALFMFAFFAVFQLAAIIPPLWAVSLACIGALLNPLGFFLRAMNPELIKSPTKLYESIMAISFLATTIGFMAHVLLLTEYGLAKL